MALIQTLKPKGQLISKELFDVTISVVYKSKSTPRRTQLIKHANNSNTDPDKCMSDLKMLDLTTWQIIQTGENKYFML